MDWYFSELILTENCSNNALSYSERSAILAGKKPELHLPKLIKGTLQDVVCSDSVVFEDFDDDGILRSCKGLKDYVETRFDVGGKQIPVYVFDNHNHAFSFWCKERSSGNVANGSLLIHVDQHKDTRIPPSYLSVEHANDLYKVYEYTNTVLNVGNFIPAAQHIGLVKDIVFIDSERSIDEFEDQILLNRSVILDIDLDFFVPDLDYIGNQKKLDLLLKVIPFASVITFATSPFFIEQKLALDWLGKIAGSLSS